jgi:hypothetical protein
MHLIYSFFFLFILNKFIRFVYLLFVLFICQDPVVLRKIEETNKRHQLIKKIYQEIKESKDPEEKKRLNRELEKIQEARLREFNQAAFKFK